MADIVMITGLSGAGRTNAAADARDGDAGGTSLMGKLGAIGAKLAPKKK